MVQRPYNPQSLRYFLSCPFQKTLAKPSLDYEAHTPLSHSNATDLGQGPFLSMAKPDSTPHLFIFIHMCLKFCQIKLGKVNLTSHLNKQITCVAKREECMPTRPVTQCPLKTLALNQWSIMDT